MAVGIEALLDRFPKFKFNDATTYLLGYCLEKQNDFEGSQQRYHDVIDDYPKSRFVTEAWVRIGEYYFDDYDDPDALPQAANAYEHAIKDTQSPLYDKALYKLGWTYYRQDRFEPAVQRFLELVDYYDRTGPKVDGKSTGDLRGEAQTRCELADLLHDSGVVAAARRHREAALAVFDKLADP